LNVGAFAVMPESNGPPKYMVVDEGSDIHQAQMVADCIVVVCVGAKSMETAIIKKSERNNIRVFNFKFSF
jgi:hypothetical protein